ncbi:hypothetical protein BJV74DRAFT_752861, partial [Russula compacta]
RGTLQKGHRMTIETLLNPVKEQHIIDDATEEEICCTVLEAWEAAKDASSVPTTSEDHDAFPSCCEYLQASSVMNKFIARIGDPSAHKLEAGLALFNNQMDIQHSQSLTSTKITQYF